METIAYAADGEDELEFSINLEEDPVRSDELSRFTVDEKYRATEQQILQDGKLGDAAISAYIKKATFGTFNGQAACLIHLGLDFCPKNGKSLFRFRSAKITIMFEEVDKIVQPTKDDEKYVVINDSDNKVLHGLYVLAFYPELIRGHIQHSTHTHGVKVYAEPAAIGVGSEIGWSKTYSREGKHVIQGRKMRTAQPTVRWTIDENEAAKSGIYEQPSFAVIVRYRVDRSFTMKLEMEATMFGGLPVKGKKGSRIIFKQPNDQKNNGDLAKEDLEELTKMRANLLGKEGPGGGQAV